MVCSIQNLRVLGHSKRKITISFHFRFANVVSFCLKGLSEINANLNILIRF